VSVAALVVARAPGGDPFAAPAATKPVPKAQPVNGNPFAVPTTAKPVTKAQPLDGNPFAAPTTAKPVTKAQPLDGNPFAAPTSKQFVYYEAESPAEKKTRAALDAPTTMEFVETPLKDVIDYLKDFHHIQIQLDSKELNKLGVADDTQITASLKEMTLRSALGLMLAKIPNAELTFVFHDEVLLITTKERAQSYEFLVTRVYDVADLVACRDSKGQVWDDYETLIKTITQATDPNTWEQTSGKGTITGASLGAAKVLVVSQGWEIHEEISGLLKKIREAAGKRAVEYPPEFPQRDPPKQAGCRGR
jgi:hypothetical protein